MKENNRLFLGRIKAILICMGLALFFFGITFPTGVGHAQRRGKGEWVLPENYPDGFDGWGGINRVAEDEVVIDDNLLKLSPYIKYHTPKKMNASRTWFRVGSIVGYLTNSGGEIISMWLIK